MRNGDGRVSEVFNLGVGQAVLEFVDVRTDCDVPLFLFPSALEAFPDRRWKSGCMLLISSFFMELIKHISQGNLDNAASILVEVCHEPKETRLGLSTTDGNGKPFDTKDAMALISKIQETGTDYIDQLEDTALFINRVGPDKISDMTINLIKPKLIEFTQRICDDFPQIAAHMRDCNKRCWDASSKSWITKRYKIPFWNGKDIILVPKALVRISTRYSYQKLYRDHILRFFEEQEILMESSLVQTTRRGRKYVYVKNLKEKYPGNKDQILKYIIENPKLLKDFKNDYRPDPSLTDEQLINIIQKTYEELE